MISKTTFLLFLHLVAVATETNITFFPDGVIEEFYENEEMRVQFNLTTPEVTSRSISAKAADEVIATVVANETQVIADLEEVDGVYKGTITVRGKRLGRTDVEFYIHETGTRPTDDDLIGEEYNKLRVIVLRRRRVVDDVFRYGIIALAAILYIGFGCKINLSTIWKIVRRPVSPAIGLACQFVIMPLIGFGLGQAFRLENALGFGLLTLACSPGGGSSNVWVSVFDGNLDLSLTMTTVSTFASLGMMPFWLYMFGHYYLSPRFISIPYGDIVRSLLTIVLPCAVGLIIRRFLPKVADKIVWFTRPFAGIFILYILTFGTYVNLYMYEIMGNDPVVIPAAILLPLLGYCFGMFLAFVTRRDHSTMATISIETGVQNASIPILILQGSFPQPEGDVAAVMPVAASLFYTIPILIAWGVFLVYRRYHPKEENEDDVPMDSNIKSYDLNALESPEDIEKGSNNDDMIKSYESKVIGSPTDTKEGSINDIIETKGGITKDEINVENIDKEEPKKVEIRNEKNEGEEYVNKAYEPEKSQPDKSDQNF